MQKKKTLEKQKVSFVETKGCFCFSLNKRTAKKVTRKLNGICIHYFSKNTEKCFPINL